MHSKNMSLAFPISGRILWLVSSIILSLSSPHQATTGSKVRRVPDWCSAIHCHDCARSEVSVCSNGAASNRSGDLCGCCHSCVQIRDFRESCGSQLAVRSAPKNFVNSRSRFTVLATTSCGPGLVCINFTCERSENEVDRVGAAPVERKGERTEAKSGSSENDGSEEPDDLRTNVITVENSHEFHYRRPDYDNVDNSPLDTDDAFTTREIDPGRSTSIPWPFSLTTEMLPTTGRQLYKAIESRRPNKELDSSVHLVNVMMSGREFQLIHGRDALADLELLLQSVDKTQSTSILDEFDALLLYERFEDVLELVNSGGKSSRPKEVIDLATGVSTTVDSQEHSENENRSLVEAVRDSGGLGVLRNFASPHASKLPRTRIPLRFPSKFRRKRELEDSENEGPSSEYSEVVIYDFFNDTPRTMTDPSRRWFIAREVETTSGERSPTARLSDPDVSESTINIRITGIPGTTNSASEFELVDEERINDGRTASSQDRDTYDDKLEIFVSEANTEVPNFSEADESLEESANFTTSPMSESYQSFGSQSGDFENATDNDWRTSTSVGENSGYFGANYEFTFPESPVVMEDDDHALALRVNETVDEFRAQLNRIETKVVVIESSLYNVMTKLGTNERSAGIANEKLGDTIESDNSYSASNASEKRRDGRRIFSPRRATHFPDKNSTYTYLGPSLHSVNGRSFKVEDEGVAQLIPIRSNRRWRTVSWQPGQVEARKVFESQGRLHPSRSGVDKIREEVHLDPGRKKSTLRRVSDSGGQDLIARRYRVRKVPKEAPTRSPRKIQSQTFLSSIDTGSSAPPADIFSRERYSLRVTPLSSSPPVVRPLSSIRSSLLTERTKRKSSEADGRGRNSKTEETPMARESVVLETQIPKPLRAREFKDFDNGMGASPTRLATIPMEGSPRRSLDEEDNWNWSSWDDGPALDLFVVNGERTESGSEFRAEVSSRIRESPTIVLPMENENPGIPEENWETFYPSYLDYSERLLGGEETEKEESPIKAEATESTTNLRRARRISAEGGKRMKRAADFFQAGQSGEAIVSRPKKRSTDRQPTIQNKSSSAQEYYERLRQVRIAAIRTWLGSREELDDTNLTDDANLRMKRAADFSQSGQSGEAIVSRPKKRSTDSQSTIQNKGSSAQRQKRGVQMADWLRAAQEYHERLRQVRTAALRTWLASREELDDSNLTDVKLFTREIPTYLERYRPSSTAEEDSAPNGEATQLHPMEVEDPQDEPSSIPDDDHELFIEFLRNQSASLRNDSKADTRNYKNGRDPSGEMSLSTARKFTIIATGNSTIRIEELPERGDEIEESPLEDQSAQGSISMDRRTALTTGESEDFDHMYEGVDAEDGDFDYGDPNFALSRWLDEVDIIDASSVEIPVDKAESTTGDAAKDEEDYEVDELLSRSKRDSPLFLFRVNGEPGQEVLVWPANWKDFIDRHFGRNRTGNSPRRATKRTRTRISKLGPARTAVSETIKNSRERDDAVSPSAGRTGDEGAEKDSSMELAFARKFQESFDNRPRQSKRKNFYRSNIGNYK